MTIAPVGENVPLAGRIQEGVDAVAILNPQIERLLEAVSEFKTATYIVLVVIIGVVGIVFWARKALDNHFMAALDEAKIKLQSQADQDLTRLEAIVARQADDHKALLERIGELGKSLLRSSEAVDTDLRSRRAVTHLALWKHTGMLPSWPRDPAAGYRKLRDLSEGMRKWYFEGGGLYLSTEAMAYYRMAQQAIACFPTPPPDELLEEAEYEDVRGYLSRLRTKLTEDLLSRNAPFEAARQVSDAQSQAERVAPPRGSTDVDHDEQRIILCRSGRLAQLLAIDEIDITSNPAGGVKYSERANYGLQPLVDALVAAQKLSQPSACVTASSLLQDKGVVALNEKRKPKLDTVDVRAVGKVLGWDLRGRSKPHEAGPGFRFW